MPKIEKFEFHPYLLKKKISNMVMSIGLAVGLMLSLAQLYTNYSTQSQLQNNNFGYALKQTIQPLTKVIVAESFKFIKLDFL